MFRSPLFAWSPRPDQDTPATQSSSRFNAVRTMMNGSSVYSESPALPNQTPRAPFLGFFRRDQSPSPDPNHAQHTASSYIATIQPNQPQPSQELQSIQTNNTRRPSLPRQDNNSSNTDPEIEQLQEEISGQRRRHRRRKHRNHEHHDQWVRRRKGRGGLFPGIKSTEARGKLIASLLSGSFMLLVLTIYLSISLTQDVGQEIHILFVFVLLSTAIFFCHSLIRLTMFILHPKSSPPTTTTTSPPEPPMPNLMAPEGFQPIIPIRVHLARDEEIGLPTDDANNMVDPIDSEKDDLPPPPPAYGLWRSSVRVNPNLLHWQRVEDDPRASHVLSTVSSRSESVSSAASSGSVNASYARGTAGDAGVDGRRRRNSVFEAETEGLRPPSYVSEDNTTYISEAVMGSSDIHPAWRPGYQMSDTRPAEPPRR